MKVLIAVPCMDQVAAGFAQSLATLNKVGECSVAFIQNSLIYDSRNKIAKMAIEMQSDFVMWFDSDMIFAPDVLERLMKHAEDGKDIISGLYFRRAAPYTPVLFKTLTPCPDGMHAETFNDYPDETFECAGIGFGCALVRTQVLFDMAAKFGDWFSPIGRIGEDIAFCIRARELGYKIHVDPTIKCGHIGQAVITESFYKMVREK